MDKKRMFACLFLGGILIIASGSVFAGSANVDDNPASWRGQDGSTWAVWDFLTDDLTPAPDAGENPYGDPTCTVWLNGNDQWVPEMEYRPGIWPLSGSITLEIPNRPEPLPEKLIQIQLVWQDKGSRPAIEEVSGLNVVSAVISQEIALDDLGWMYTIYDMVITPNPDNEILYITGNIYVDSLVVDTICIPEPATMALLAVGGMALLRRRR